MIEHEGHIGIASHCHYTTHNTNCNNEQQKQVVMYYPDFVLEYIQYKFVYFIKVWDIEYELGVISLKFDLFSALSIPV